jgi:Ca2+-binding RTX toxin-like protein
VDLVVLENAVFVQVGAAGALNAAMFAFGSGKTNAANVTEKILYDTDTGTLYYDTNGAMPGSTAFAILDGTPALTAADFNVI